MELPSQGEQVHVAESDSPAQVYHTRRHCSQIPAKYEAVSIDEAREQGYRLCLRCDEARFDGLEL